MGIGISSEKLHVYSAIRLPKVIMCAHTVKPVTQGDYPTIAATYQPVKRSHLPSVLEPGSSPSIDCADSLRDIAGQPQCFLA